MNRNLEIKALGQDDVGFPSVNMSNFNEKTYKNDTMTCIYSNYGLFRVVPLTNSLAGRAKYRTNSPSRLKLFVFDATQQHVNYYCIGIYLTYYSSSMATINCIYPFL
jgi:hypothetical protein